MLCAEGFNSCKWVLRSKYSTVFSGEFENHFLITTETCQLLTQEMMHNGRIPTGNSSGRPTTLPENQIQLFLWRLANKEPYRTIAEVSCEWNKIFVIPEINRRGCTLNIFTFHGILPFHSVSDRKSRNFWSIGKRAASSILNLELHNIKLDIRGARNTDIEFMNCTRGEVISIARSIIS